MSNQLEINCELLKAADPEAAYDLIGAIEQNFEHLATQAEIGEGIVRQRRHFFFKMEKHIFSVWLFFCRFLFGEGFQGSCGHIVVHRLVF